MFVLSFSHFSFVVSDEFVKARIQLRKVGTDEVLDYYLNGEEPAYVDMPVWYTHNISNIGDEILYAQFWINEWYDPTDSDTYFEPVVKDE